jgi:glycosyltransferase involved in cell wall biosynthesis
MKIFAISHSSVVPRFRRKWEELSRFPDVDLTLLVPRSWPEAGTRVTYSGGDGSNREDRAPYRIVSRWTAFTGIHAAHFYPVLHVDMGRARPDIVHIEEEPWNVGTLHAACLARRLGARVIFFTWENVWRRYPFPLPPFLRAVLRLADGAIAGNHEGAELLRRRGFRNAIDVLPQYGVDAPEPGGIRHAPRDVFTVGFAGRLVPQKGLDTLLGAVARLPGHVRCLVVGDGPYRRAVTAQADAYGLNGRLEITGSVPHQVMHDYLSRMDVLVLPSRTTSRWKEQFGRVLVEAMALGVPVIGSTSGEIPAVVGDTGLLFPEGDVEALRDRICRLMNDEALRTDLARRACARALTRYTNQAVADATREIYRRCLGRKAG